jgi:hypothetical protein
MNKLKALVILLIISGISFAQSKEELKEAALRDANLITKATLKFDFRTIFKYTFPSVIDMMGGKEPAAKMLESSFDKMKTEGFEFEKAEVVSVSDVVFENNEYRCLVESFIQIKMANMRVKTKSYTLGIYNSDDKIWQFIESKQLKNSSLTNVILPGFKTNLEIPDDEMTTEQL